MNTQLLKTVKINSYDLVLLAKADLIDYELIPEINKHAPTWYFMNDWIVIAKDIQADKRVANATFASATRSNVTEFFCNAGANAVFLTQGANTRLFYPDPDVPKEYDVVFVGTLRKDRKEYIDYLQANGVKVSTFGKDMEHGHVFGKELADVYRKSKIVLNFNTTINNTGFSLRVFEVMGCGAFLLSEHCKDLETLFTNRKEMVWFKTPQECLDAVREFLQKETDREQIAHKGLKRIQDEFTWDHIIARICDTVTSGRHT